MRLSSTTLLVDIKEFKQIPTAGATTAAFTERGLERVYVVAKILKRT